MNSTTRNIRASGSGSPHASEDFGDFLRYELLQRCKSNPHYSLRAFARSLSVSPSFLSMLLASKRKMTDKTIDRLSKPLHLSHEAVRHFKNAVGSSMDSTPREEFRQIAFDHFRSISDWYHYAILELVAVEGFRPDARWVARSLGISSGEVKAGVERLVRLDLLKITPSGKWQNCLGNNSNSANDLVMVARRNLQKQILEKAITALDEVPMDIRDQSSMTMAIDSSRIVIAKKLLNQFRRKLSTILQEGGTRDSVYHLSLSLYPVTKSRKKRSLT